MEKSKKVAIFTLNGYYNYGNRLQNYALQEVLKSFGYEVDTIRINRSEEISLLKRLMSISSFKEFLGKIKKRILIYTTKDIKKRENIFKKFSKEYIKESERIIFKDSEAVELNDKYDFFVTGSDQVWNPYNLHGTTFYFLTFAHVEKRIAYAPSFGISEIPEDYIERYSKWLNEMTNISVREETGAEIIKRLTGRKAPVLIDPTLLLTKEKWLAISNKATIKNEKKYLLTYFLDSVPNEFKKQIKDLSDSNNLQIINLADIKDKTAYITGPSEFIDYINNCSIFCTNSFHGAVFSILMEKPFIIYERSGTSIYSRIDTLLEKFNLNSRKSVNIKTNADAFNVDYSNVKVLLDKEREKSIKYLKDALKINEE